MRRRGSGGLRGGGGSGRRRSTPRRGPEIALENQRLIALIEKHPALLEVLHDHGVHFCAGCYLTLSAPLAKAAAWHAVPDLGRFLKDVEKVLARKNKNGER